MTRGQIFDLNNVLSRIESGEFTPACPLKLPANGPVCANPKCEDGFVQVQEGSGPYGPRFAPCGQCRERRAKCASHATLKATGLADMIYDIPPDSLDLTHESWQIAWAYAENVRGLVSERQSLIFVGDYGRGKTQAAMLILSHAHRAGYTVGRVKWGQFGRQVRATYNRDSTLTEDALISTLVMPDLLLLDDIGAADKHSDHNERLLTAVIDERYDRGRPTIITTNLGRAELETHLGGRAFSRMWNNADIIIFDGPNYRELYERPRVRNLALELRGQINQPRTGSTAN